MPPGTVATFCRQQDATAAGEPREAAGTGTLEVKLMTTSSAIRQS
jgi:hypothetical protein